MPPAQITFPPTLRTRALVGVTGLLAVCALGLASLAYSAATAPRETRQIGGAVDAAPHAIVTA